MLDADKKETIRRLLRELPDLQYDQVARIIAVDTEVVRQIRDEMRRNEKLPMPKTLRSDFLIHWTGKDIHTNYKNLSDCQRNTYVERLCSTLTGDYKGLWVKEVCEKIYASGHRGIPRKWPLTSFTEIKLSQVHKHTERYGCLGFGFSRGFVLKRYGAPVQYVAGGRRPEDIISQHTFKLYEILDSLGQLEARYPRLNKFLLEHLNASSLIDVLQILFNDEQRSRPPTNVFGHLMSSIKTNSIFIKDMSESQNGDAHDFRNLDELEWRIPYIKSGKQPCVKPCIRRLLKPDEIADCQSKYKIEKRDDVPKALVQFDQEDLKVLILPDEKARKLALNNDNIWKWLRKDKEHLPAILTVAECLQF